MSDYMSGQFYATFRGNRQEPYEFTCWRGANSDELLVLVMEFRVAEEPLLEWVKSEGIQIDGGYMVPMRRWEARITPDGLLR